MKKILLPTDFSENSWNAISYALQLFKEDICTFYLLHTYTPIVYHADYALLDSSQLDMSHAIREEAIKGLKRLEKRILETFNNPKHSFKTKAVFNTLTLEVNEMVKEESIDYVVMGTKGATGAKEILFGSNTVHVFNQVKCPVLAIPDGFSFEPSLEILFPTDYGINYKEKQTTPIIELASKYHSNIHVLNVSYGRDLSESQKKNKTTLMQVFNKVSAVFHSVRDQELTKAISDFQIKNRVDLLIMINNKHSFFENLFFKSTINQIGFHLKIPFLVIPSKKK